MSLTIVVPLDGSPLANEAVPHAAELARRSGGALHLVRVHQPVPLGIRGESMAAFADPGLDASIEEAARAWLSKTATEVSLGTHLPVSSEFRIGLPVDEIADAARTRDASAIVCTTHGSGGWAPQWLGSVADGLIRHSGCPVLAMSETAVRRPLRLRKMLVLLDGFETSSAILPSARWVARVFGAEIELLRVAEAPWFGDGPVGVDTADADRFGLDERARDAKEVLDAVAAGLRRDGFAATTIVKVSHDVGRTILEHIESTDPDIVALSTQGRGLSRLFVGSVANKVLRAGGRPMLCLRPSRSGVAGPSALREDAFRELAHTVV